MTPHTFCRVHLWADRPNTCYATNYYYHPQHLTLLLAVLPVRYGAPAMGDDVQTLGDLCGVLLLILITIYLPQHIMTIVVIYDYSVPFTF